MTSRVTASSEVIRGWQALRRSRAVWRGLAVVAWLSQIVVLLILGDNPLSGSAIDDWPSGRIPLDDRGITAGLVVSRLRGWPSEREVHVARRLPIRLRGRAATVAGRLYRSRGDIVWIPDRTWQRLDARDLLLRSEDVAAMQLVPLGRRSGLTLVTSDGAEIWLWLGRRARDLTEWQAA
jgi:hypothetical protein